MPRILAVSTAVVWAWWQWAIVDEEDETCTAGQHGKTSFGRCGGVRKLSQQQSAVQKARSGRERARLCICQRCADVAPLGVRHGAQDEWIGTFK